MSKGTIELDSLTAIANAIRGKLGVQDTYTPGQMPGAIQSIPTGGITPTGTVNISQNGTHDVTEYASANVNVQPTLQSKTVNQNGTVTPDAGYDGLSSVLVDVQGGGSSYLIQPVVTLNQIHALTNTTATYSGLNVGANEVFIMTIEVSSYTGTVTFDDPSMITVLYSDNSSGYMRMIITNNGAWNNASLTLTISVNQYIRTRRFIIANATGIEFKRSGIQGSASSGKCTVATMTEGYALYVCFDNHGNYSSQTGDLLEQWYAKNSFLFAIPISLSNANWPNSGIIMPATVFIKYTRSALSDIVFFAPLTYSNPNVCELLLTTPYAEV